MDELRIRALGDFHQKLRTGIIVNNILPEIASYLRLTAVERSQVEAKSSNVTQVDDLLTILRTKDNWHFDGFCIVLERNGYEHWAKQLQAAATTEPNGRRASWVTVSQGRPFPVLRKRPEKWSGLYMVMVVWLARPSRKHTAIIIEDMQELRNSGRSKGRR